jgi:hypothetical protein
MVMEESKETSGAENTEQVDEKIVQEAVSQGWVSKDKYRGDEKDWVGAETFVKRGREILPILRKNNENLLKELNQTKENLKEFKQAADEFKKFQKDSYARKAKDLEAQVEQLKDARAEAISNGDGKRVNALDDAIDTVKEEVKVAKDEGNKVTAKPTPNITNTVDPNLQHWLDRNPWFGKDKRQTGIANSLGEALREEQPHLRGEAFLSKLDEVLAEELPQRFGKRTPNYTAESGSNRERPSGNNGKRSYSDLPPEAKAACDRFVKQKLMTKETYVSEYDWSN